MCQGRRYVCDYLCIVCLWLVVVGGVGGCFVLIVRVVFYCYNIYLKNDVWAGQRNQIRAVS